VPSCSLLAAAVPYTVTGRGSRRVGGHRGQEKPFSLVFAPAVHDHLSAIDTKYDSLIRQKTEEQLTHEPEVETRNRKPVRAPAAFQAEWELRFGPNNRFRVFYQIDHEHREVRIVAIGVKDRNRLLVGGEEVTL